MVADKESRTHDVHIEWRLQPEVFGRLCSVFQVPEVDLFASRINKQIDRFMAWRPDPDCIHVDAFTANC